MSAINYWSASVVDFLWVCKRSRENLFRNGQVANRINIQLCQSASIMGIKDFDRITGIPFPPRILAKGVSQRLSKNDSSVGNLTSKKNVTIWFMVYQKLNVLYLTQFFSRYLWYVRINRIWILCKKSVYRSGFVNV